MVLGHEITGEVIETGPGCEFIKVGDICSVPFNIACGRCAACKRGDTGVCLNVNPARPGAAYGYVCDLHIFILFLNTSDFFLFSNCEFQVRCHGWL